MKIHDSEHAFSALELVSRQNIEKTRDSLHISSKNFCTHSYPQRKTQRCLCSNPVKKYTLRHVTITELIKTYVNFLVDHLPILKEIHIISLTLITVNCLPVLSVAK